MTTPNLSPEHRSRLADLADLLDIVDPKRFDMVVFYRNPDLEKVPDPYDASIIGIECGTAGCALGWATSLFAPLHEAEDWDAYSNRVFGARAGSWNWLFSPDGALDEVDNTPRGAAARIRWLLSHGLPEDWPEQMNGEAKLCYEVTAA